LAPPPVALAMWAMEARAMTANYDLEMYAKALEAMSNEPPMPFVLKITGTGQFYGTAQEYAEYLNKYLGSRTALWQAARMLRMTPKGLWVNYPDHFPDPEATDAD